MTSATQTDSHPLVRPRLHGVTPPVEAAIVLLVLAGLSVLLLGGPLWHGGLYTDDWPIAQIYGQRGGTGYLIQELFLGDHSRPLAAVYLGVSEWFVGSNPHLHALFGLITHVLACGAVYWLLRRWSMSWWEAGLVTALFLLYPYSDSTWLWFAITQSNLSTAFAAWGLIALTGALAAGGRKGAWLQALAVVLMAASVLTYESASLVMIVATLVLATRSAYVRLGDRRTAATLAIDAARRAAPCVIAVILALLIPRIGGLLPGVDPHTGLSRSAEIDHARTMAGQAVTLAANSSVPFGSPHRNVVIPILLLIVIVALLVWWRAPSGSELRSQLQRWLGWGVAGAVVIAAAYLVFVNTDVSYVPLGVGEYNRTNAVAAIGYCLAIFAAARIVGVLLTAGRSPTMAAAITAALGIALAVGYADLTRTDIGHWDRAGEDQRAQLQTLSRIVGRPAPGTTMYVYGGTGTTAVNVFAFRVTWDLNGAVRLHWNEPSISAYPIFAGTTFVCGRTTMYPSSFGNGDGISQQAAYGHALFVDLRNGKRALIASQAQCRSAQRSFVPGPLTG